MTILEKFIQFINKMFISIQVNKIGVKYSYNSSYTEKEFKKTLLTWVKNFSLQERKELINYISMNYNRDIRAIFDLIEVTEALNNYVHFAKENHFDVDLVLFDFQIIKGFAGVVCFSYLDMPVFDSLDYDIEKISDLFLSNEEFTKILDELHFLREKVVDKFYQLRKTCYYLTDNADALLQKTINEEANGYDIIANGKGNTSYTFFLNMQDY